MVRRTTRSGLPRDGIRDVLKTIEATESVFPAISKNREFSDQARRLAKEMPPQIKDMKLLLKARLED